MDDDFHDDLEWEEDPTEDDIARQDEMLLQRQRSFRAAAERVAAAWAGIAAVSRRSYGNRKTRPSTYRFPIPSAA